MNRCQRAILAPLLAVVAMVLGFGEKASAAFNAEAQNPHYGENLLWEAEASTDWPLEIADPTKGNGEWIYDSALGVPAYVRQNPWSSFDPLGLRIKIDGEDYDGENIGKDDDQKMIYDHYKDADYDFEFSTLDSFKETVATRGQILKSARLLKEKGVRFSGMKEFEADGSFWEVDSMSIALGRGGASKNWDKALHSLMSSSTSCDCTAGLTLIYLHAFRAMNAHLSPPGAAGTPFLSTNDPFAMYRMGENGIFGTVNTNTKTFQGAYQNFMKRSYISTEEVDSKRPSIPGDWVYFANHSDYNSTKGAWAGENAVYMGNGSYLGHGVSGSFNSQQMRGDLLKAMRSQNPSGIYQMSDIPKNPGIMYSPR